MLALALLSMPLRAPGVGAGPAAALGLDLPASIVAGPDERVPLVDDLDARPEDGEDGEAWLSFDSNVEWEAHFEYQRVDGLALGLRPTIHGDGRFGPTLRLGVTRAFSRGRWLYLADFEQPVVPGLLSVGGNLFRRTTPFDGLDPIYVDSKENTLAALFIKEDFRDYYEDDGVQLFVRQRFGRGRDLRVSVVHSRHRSVKNGTRTSLTRWDRDFRPNPGAREGTFRAYRVEFEHDTRPSRRAPATAAWYRLQWERANGGLGGAFEYSRFLAELRNDLRTSPGQMLSWRFLYGTNRSGSLPTQKRFAIGGVGTLRGHAFKAFEGEHVLLANAEYRFDLDSDWFALVFLDTGATAERDESIEDKRFALDGGIGLGVAGERAAIYIGRDLRDPDADVKFSFRLTSTF